jgi:hypothetical protein
MQQPAGSMRAIAFDSAAVLALVVVSIALALATLSGSIGHAVTAALH